MSLTVSALTVDIIMLRYFVFSTMRIPWKLSSLVLATLLRSERLVLSMWMMVRGASSLSSWSVS